ncbi:MAG: hypothetical protein KBC41_03745 [Candidatus Pacebacteria bacterium]|nr:hypothetical protein [Candidatus Paceibacterota bacterium]MBP9867160.1 hypothetical protein [Candidatus Paceibacterota bacterium]
MIERPEITKYITEQDITLCKKITEFIFNFELYLINELLLTCHSLTRILAHNIPELRVIDGHYLGLTNIYASSYIVTRTEHSWLLTPDNTILETCPLGFLSAMPFLIPTKGESLHTGGTHYLTNPELGEKIRRKVETEELLEIISLANNLLNKKIKI